MRKVVCISMMLLFLATIITAVAELHVHPGSSGHHIIMALLFVAATLTHVWINRKPFTRYFMGSANNKNKRSA
jgi:hypothetical protein